MVLDYNGQVAVITGAGAGLGRAYALLFAERGAKVVVNDLGGRSDGEGSSSSAADGVVAEIKQKGGIAVADYNSVVEGEKIIQTALENFGRVDILVNNAGILRDKSFARISDADWDMIHNVHVKGAFKTTQAAWPHFRKQNYGRVIVTSSNSGLYGNFGQANYSAAKMALVGLCNTLAIEGRKNNINCNVIVPTAGSRLTQGILPPDFFEQLKPELIAPVVCWLCHKSCEENGSIIEAAAGWATKYFLMRSKGSILRHNIIDAVSIEDVQKKWNTVTDMDNVENISSIEEASGSLMTQLEEMKSGGKSNDVRSSNTEESGWYTYEGKDCILYALGIGCTVQNESDLKYLYEGHESFSNFPTFAVLPSLFSLMSSGKILNSIPGREVNLSQMLHGEQYIEISKQLPTSGKLRNEVHVVDVLDKGKSAVLIVNVDSYDESGDKVVSSQVGVVFVGAGGFGGKRKSDKSIDSISPPNRKPDKTVTQKTSPDQAALYRLSGDSNPLHIDPSFSALGGFEKPILHGLCTLGFSSRHVLAAYGNNDATLFKALKVRFVNPVLPGQTVKTEMWQEKNRIHFQTSVVESGKIVISGAHIDLHEVHKSLEETPHHVSTSSSGSMLQSDAVFAGIEESLKANKDVVKKINGIFVYDILKDGKKVVRWTLDLKKGKVYKGDPEKGVKHDALVTVDDQDMMDIATGKLKPQVAFMKGKLKVKGNVMLLDKLKNVMTTHQKL